MTPEDSVFVAGHRGLVGSAIVRRLRAAGFANLVLRTRSELDLTRQLAVDEFFAVVRPNYVILAAAKVGGILANCRQPVEFLRDNLLIQNNIIDAAYRNDTRKLLFIASSCIYPRLVAQPICEDYLMTGPLEPTNESYALAKIAGLRLCQAYRRQFGFKAITIIPANVYGPGDHFDLETSHALPALLRKFHDAKERGAPEVEIWGTGQARREWLHVDDLAESCLYFLHNYDREHPINIGWGVDVSILELAAEIQRVVKFEGALRFDLSKPDGMPRKLLDVSRLTALGWKPQIQLEAGLRSTYTWFLENRANAKI